MLLNVPVPVESGFSSVLQNVGEIENKGFEISLNTVNIEGDFGWNSSLNYSANKNEVLSLGGPEFYFTGWVGGGNHGHNDTNIIRMAPGEPVGAFWGPIYDGVWKSQADIDEAGHMPSAKPGSGNYRDLNGDKKFDALDDTYIGNPNPDFIFGFNNDFSYKNFTLNVFLYGEMGQEVAFLSKRRLTGGTSLWKEDRDKRWSPSNPEGTTLAANQGTLSMMSTENVVDGSFVRVKNIALTYNLPVSKMNIDWLRSLQITAAADNPFLFTDYEGYDPEVNSYGTTNDVKGVDRFSYPSVKGYRIGLRVGF